MLLLLPFLLPFNGQTRERLISCTSFWSLLILILKDTQKAKEYDYADIRRQIYTVVLIINSDVTDWKVNHLVINSNLL